MLFDRQSICTRVLLDVSAHSYPSLVIATRLFECPSVSRHESQQGLSHYVPTPSPSPHLSRCTRPCLGRLGRTSSIPISCGISGACTCHLVGEHAGVGSHDTAFYLPPAEQPSVILDKIARARVSVALPASSSTSLCTTLTVGSNASLIIRNHDSVRQRKAPLRGGAYGTKSEWGLAFNKLFPGTGTNDPA